MKFLLDTNTCIRFLNARSEKLLDRLTAERDEDIAVCSIVKAEMFFGSAKSVAPEKSRAVQRAFFARYTSLAFDDSAAIVYGPLRADLEKKGRPIGPNDLLIASIAVANSLTLVTHNTVEFGRVPGLQLEDWEK